MTKHTQLNQYEVLERVGAGGMGEVYRARDTRLERDVALKILHRRFGDDPAGRRRLQREARLVAQLTHPNIGAIHGLEEAGGIMFLVLELVDGVTLAERLEAGALDLDAALDIAEQICAAGAEAHRREILHRDLKPGNVMLDERGRVRVLDFGLATCRGAAREKAPADEPTMELSVDYIDAVDTIDDPAAFEGTPGYMSPEQLRGGSIDARTDVWVVGCILFEMLAGRPAFVAASMQETLDHVANRDPDWGLLPHGTPECVRVLLAQMLDKRPARRVGDLRDARVLIDGARSLLDGGGPTGASERPAPLRRLASIAPLVLVPLLVAALALASRDPRPNDPGRSIAVLPIENLTGEPRHDTFAAGFTEELTTELGGIRALKVVSRSSARAATETRSSLPEIAERLGVRALVEASLSSGRPLRLSVRLYDAVGDAQLWGQTFDAEGADVERLQSRITQTIAARLGVEMTARERRRLSATRAVDPQASAAYLTGRYWASRHNGFRAIDEYRRAVQIDPGYGPAWAALANAYVYRLPSSEFMPQARHAAQTALNLDDTLGEAHAALGQVLFFFDWDWRGAEDAFERALALAPNSAVVRQRYASLLWAIGRLDEARSQLQQAQQLDPMSLFIKLELARTDYFAGDYAAARDGYHDVLELAPDFWWAHLFLGINDQQSGMLDSSARQLIAAFDGFRGELSDLLRGGYEVAGYPGLMRAWIAAGVKDERVQPTSLAAQHAFLGDNDGAFDWLEKAFEQRTRALVWIGVDPQFAPLRKDPRFATLLTRMALAVGRPTR